MEALTVRGVRTDPYPSDRLIMRMGGRFLPSWVTPNQITILRLAATPVVFFLLLHRRYGVGLIVFLLLAFSDALDGALARTRNQITAWGIAYDPIADKLLIAGSVLILAMNRLGMTLTMVIIGLEVATLLGGMYFKFVRKILFPANVWGKAKMFLQVVATALLMVDGLLPIPLVAHGAFVIYIVASCFAFLSLLSHGA